MAKRARLSPLTVDDNSVDSTDVLLDAASASTYFDASESVVSAPDLVADPIIKIVAAADDDCKTAAQLHCDAAGSSSSAMTQHLTPSTSTGNDNFHRKRRRIVGADENDPTPNDALFRTPPRSKSRLTQNAEQLLHLRQRPKRQSPHRPNPPQPSASMPNLITPADTGAHVPPLYPSTSGVTTAGVQQLPDVQQSPRHYDFSSLGYNLGLFYPQFLPSAVARPQIVPNEHQLRLAQLGTEHSIADQHLVQQLTQLHQAQLLRQPTMTRGLSEPVANERPMYNQSGMPHIDLQAYQASVAQEAIYQQQQLAFHQAIIQQLVSQVQMLTSNMNVPLDDPIYPTTQYQQQQAMHDLLYTSAPAVNPTTSTAFEQQQHQQQQQRPHVHIFTNGLGSHWANFTDPETLLAIAEHMAAAAAHAYNRMPKGLVKAQIEQLPSYRWPTASSDGVNCVICMCDVVARQTVRALPCNHIYHVRCIDKWLKTNRTCPVCRHDASKPKDGKEESAPDPVSAAVAGPSTRA